MLTGVKDIDMMILNKLDDRDLVNTCKTNKYMMGLCNDQMFWLNRILTKFQLSLEVMNIYKGDRLWSEYYINDLRKINSKNANIYLIAGSAYSNLDWVILALNKGADIHNSSDRAIIRAVDNRDLDIVKFLVSAGADIHISHDYPLRKASKNGDLDMVMFLVSVGANIHANDNEAIKKANQYGHLDIVNYLVSINSFK